MGHGDNCFDEDEATANARAFDLAVPPAPTVCKMLRVKIGDQYGPALSGHWFWLLPADAYAERALQEHTR